MIALLSIFLPIIIIPLPFTPLFYLSNRPFIKKNNDLTLFVCLLLIALSFLSIFWSTQLSNNIMPYNSAGQETECRGNLVMFFLLGGAFTILTFGFSIYYIINNYQCNKNRKAV